MRLSRTAARLIAVALSLLSAAGGAAPSRAEGAAGSVFGLWRIEDRTAVVSIARCANGLCGTIVGLSETVGKDGRVPVDHRGTPICGLTILHAADPSPSGVWQGHIVNPNDGSSWTCEVWAAGDGLHLRGYLVVPLLGQTQIWPKYAGNVTPDCHISS